MGTHNRLMSALFVSLIAILARTANAKEPADRGNADAGRELALRACTGCHIVSDDQRFPPLLTGVPGFREIANRPNVTAASLRRTIAGAATSAAERAHGEPAAYERRTRRCRRLYHDLARGSHKRTLTDSAR
jgi:hypothetical protein